VLGNLANPLTWTFWLATGTPAMLRAQEIGGWPGLLAFTATWFVVASGLEAVVALVLARSRRPMGSRGQALFSVLSAAAFAALAAFLTVAYVLPKLGEAVSS
jgi:threonine/homoserine/homoserine lactone efflux protein